MNLNIKLRDNKKILAFAAIILAIAIVGSSLYLGVVPGMIALFAILIMWVSHQYQTRQRQIEFEQVESLIDLHFSLLNDSTPLPKTRDYAASPDFLKLIFTFLHNRKPTFILEAGSGVSTIVCGKYLKSLGDGVIISLEHDITYAEKNMKMVEDHGLRDYCRIIHAPLVDHHINGKIWKWYNLDQIDISTPVNLFIIDGPPSKIDSKIRFPAIPLLKDRLNSDSVILLDDANRKGEQKIVDEWLQIYPELKVKYLPLEEGAFVLFEGTTV